MTFGNSAMLKKVKRKWQIGGMESTIINYSLPLRGENPTKQGYYTLEV